ncbi:MAG: hypothetical protein WBW33_13680, partial [Bryobacteraceae bacterium]
LFESQTPTSNPDSTSASESELLSYAIWEEFDPGSAGADIGLSANDQFDIANLDSWAVSEGNHYSALGIGLGNLVFYTPIPPTGDVPQEFIGLTSTTPEPSSAAVLGLDLFAFGGVILFFRRRASRIV